MPEHGRFAAAGDRGSLSQPFGASLPKGRSVNMAKLNAHSEGPPRRPPPSVLRHRRSRALPGPAVLAGPEISRRCIAPQGRSSGAAARAAGSGPLLRVGPCVSAEAGPTFMPARLFMERPKSDTCQLYIYISIAPLKEVARSDTCARGRALWLCGVFGREQVVGDVKRRQEGRVRGS